VASISGVKLIMSLINKNMFRILLTDKLSQKRFIIILLRVIEGLGFYTATLTEGFLVSTSLQVGRPQATGKNDTWSSAYSSLKPIYDRLTAWHLPLLSL
jgi:hypothetical protein